MIEEFQKWEESIRQEITHVSEILSEKLPDDPIQLINAMEAAEVWNSRMQALLAQSNSWLDRASFHLMPAKEGLMESDRKAKLNNDVAPIRLIRDTIEGFCDSIKSRLILGESILSYHKQFVEHKPQVANLRPF